MTRSSLIVILSALLISGIALPATAQTADPAREISKISGDLYRLRAGDQETVFLVTPGGIVLVDPLNLETAQWLKEELARRFSPGVVRFVLHTSHRFDRAEGASVFNDTAELVGHRAFNDALSRARRGEPRVLSAEDQARRAALIPARDRNGDGRLNGDELYRRVRDIETHFDDRRAVTLGGRTIEVVHAGTPDSPAGAIVNFPAARIAFAADAPPVDVAPFTFGDLTPHDLQRWLDNALSAQFDVLMLGNGHSIQRAQLIKVSGYVNDLIGRVASEYERGTSAAEFAQSKMPPAYRSDPMFREYRAHVDSFYRDVSVFRIDATVGGLASYLQNDAVLCAPVHVTFDDCSTGGAIRATTGSLGASFGRFGLVSEFTAFEDVFSSRTSRFYDEEFALRETRVTVLGRYNVPAGAMSFRFLGGMSYSIAYREGIYRVKEAVAPFAGRHPIDSREVRWGYAGGLDLAMGRTVGIVIPLRINVAAEPASAAWPSRIDLQAGVALSLRLFRSID